LHDEYEDESMATKDEEVPYVCDKERFCRSFEWSAEIAWSAHQGIVAIDRNRRAVITLRMTINNDASVFDVAIIHKRRGVIAERPFFFADYLSMDMAHRNDTRSDYTAALYAARVGGPLHWYIVEPKTTKPLTSAIEAYISTWR